jgi:hypothetical protein
MNTRFTPQGEPRALQARPRGTPATMAGAKTNLVRLPESREPIVESQRSPRPRVNANPARVSIPQPPGTRIAPPPSAHQLRKPPAVINDQPPAVVNDPTQPRLGPAPKRVDQLNPQSTQVPFGRYEQQGMLGRFFNRKR